LPSRRRQLVAAAIEEPTYALWRQNIIRRRRQNHSLTVLAQAAKALGLNIPESLVLRGGELIE
jgi:hypothetical protein